MEVLLVEMKKQLIGDEVALNENEVSVVGRCLADILSGRDWTLRIQNAIYGKAQKEELDGLILWSQVTALMASMPCHVSRDGMLTQRHEARAAAAAMWAVRGLGTVSTLNGEPPLPLAVGKVFAVSATRPPEIKVNWGTMAPTAKKDPTSPSDFLLFRPAVASSYLYAPLLSWDLNNLAGALLSSVLLNRPSQLPCSDDLLNLAGVLITGRMVQALITPQGFDSLDSMEIDEQDEEGRWSPDDINSQGEALATLLGHCLARIDSQSLDHDFSRT